MWEGKGGFEREAIKRQKHTGISMSCIQPRAAAKQLNVGECECVREKWGTN